MTTGDAGSSGIDWDKVREIRYDQGDELMAMSEAYEAEREQFPMLRRDLRLNERGGLFRWLTILEIVSLERTAPYLAAFGLPGCEPDALRRIALPALEAIYAIEDDEDVPLLPFVEILEQALDRLAEEDSPTSAASFLEYATHRFPYFGAETRREDDWCRLFNKLVFHSLVRYPSVEPDLAPGALAKVHEAVRRHIDHDLNQNTIVADREPLTEWEEVVYARCDGWSPFDVMSETAYYFQVQAAWRAIEAELRADEVASLVEWGRRQAAVLPGVRPEEIAPPPTPRRLRQAR